MFNVLTNLFEWVGLRTNMWNKVSMSCRPCFIPGLLLESAYTRQVMETGTSYQ